MRLLNQILITAFCCLFCNKLNVNLTAAPFVFKVGSWWKRKRWIENETERLDVVCSLICRKRLNDDQFCCNGLCSNEDSN